MAQMKTPGVYIVEKDAFPDSVVEVATAVPAFVGYTERAEWRGMPLRGRPFELSSLAEYQFCFGGGPVPLLELSPAALPPGPGAAGPDADFMAAGAGWVLSPAAGPTGRRGLLHAAMRMFFANGGAVCRVVSVGDYTADVDAPTLQAGIDALAAEPEPAILVVPEAVLLDAAGCAAVQQAMLAQCSQMKSRMAILDVREGWKAPGEGGGIDELRNAVRGADRSWGAAYYPWLHTTLVNKGELGFLNVAPASRPALIGLLRQDMGLDVPLSARALPPEIARRTALLALVDNLTAACSPAAAAAGGTVDAAAAGGTVDAASIDIGLRMSSPLYQAIMGAMSRRLNLLPPSAAMAGVWANVDHTQGVWKAPANVSLVDVVSPAVAVSQPEQEALLAPIDGIAINPIRAFPGQGTLVWGARTLDSHSVDGRYISVRRTLIMLEQSCRRAARAHAFEPNAAGTWATLRGMIDNYLTGVWKRGGLAGAVPEDAFAVQVGLGETMTPQDLLEGILRVQVMVAVVRPAEFIVFTIELRMRQP